MIFDCAGFGGVSVIVFCEDAAPFMEEVTTVLEEVVPFMEEVTTVLEEVVATIGGGGVVLGGGGIRGRGTSAIAFLKMCH